ncbi:MAG: FGGY-family carbohydrate kinase [Ancalomicrobiaceae bacterium]|nr:FGGY-family carbohydrate kinase [Ancalomicrobiaceae bacterium]
MSDAGCFIGFDLGSTSIKAGLFGPTGEVLDHWSRGYPTRRPAAGIVEQDPRDWLAGIRDGIDALLAGRDAAMIAAVGMCSQVNTDVFVGEDGEPLAPAIVWQDVRAAAEAERLDAMISPAEKLAWWGSQMPIGASHALAKMMWMEKHHPDIWQRTRYVLSPKDYCLLHLTGRAVSDPISAFGQVGLDLAYIAPLLERVPGAAERLPSLHAFDDVIGEMPLGSHSRRVPVVAGTMDAWGNLFGCGVFQPGQGMYVSGTSEIMALAGARRIGAPGVVTFASVDGLVVNAGPTQSGADSLRWWSKVAGIEPKDVPALAAKASRDDRPILFLPQLEGERAPLWDSSIRGAFIGLDSRSGGPEYALAVLEGVALSARHLFGALVDAAGFRPDWLLYGGGGSQSDLWSQIRSDCLGIPLHRFTYADVGCLGAAILAAVGIGAFASIADAVPAMTHVERIFEPDPRRAIRYDRMFEAYRNAIDALRPIGLIDVDGNS